MNSSLSATSLDRQSTSLAGREEFSRAFFRRWVSLCALAEMRLFISATTLSSSSAACALSSRFVLVRRARRASESTFATMARAAGVPSTSFVCPSNCGSGMRTVSTAVRPASTSSFSSLSEPAFSRRAFFSTSPRNVLMSPCSNPARWLPPFGVAMMLTKLRTVVSYPVPQRRAMSTVHSRSSSVGVMCPLSSSTGTVSVNRPLPVIRHVSVSGASGAR
jgi:hypothetical protein